MAGRTKWFGGLAAIAVVVALGGCSSGSETIQGRTAPGLMHVNTDAHVVKLSLLASSSGGFDFDGASNGAMTITVPVGWTVKATCVNYSTRLTHSCAIVDPSTGKLAFAGATIAHATTGLLPAQSAQFSFVASHPGHYRLVCLVPGHEDAGMWDHFVVRTGGTPSMTGEQAPSKD